MPATYPSLPAKPRPKLTVPKTILAMPFVLDGEQGRVEIEAGGIKHILNFRVDRIRQEPVVQHVQEPSDVKTGTTVRVLWPHSACWILNNARTRFLQTALAYGWLTADGFGKAVDDPEP